MSIVTALQQARKARLQRMAARAVRPPAPGGGVDDPDYERAWALVMLGIGPPAVRRRLTPSVADVQRATELHYSLEPGVLAAPVAPPDTRQPRQVAMYLARALTAKSYSQIGHCFGGRLHATVLRTVRKMERELARDDVLAANIDGIRAALASRES